MKMLTGITFKEENGFFKVPADFVGGFNLVPTHKGKLQRVFSNRQRMRRYLKQYDFRPIGTDAKILNLEKVDTVRDLSLTS
ncbi:MAG: hypothetical protein HY754_00020 [Nitrospirae bacterium]|nr:hypothetical protein [Nitrospirota bacterium]